jgi:hypothetical protein
MSICCDDLGKANGKDILRFKEKIGLLMEVDDLEYEKLMLDKLRESSENNHIKIWLDYKKRLITNAILLYKEDIQKGE